MLVSKYPNWVASVVYKGGHVQHFDGAKDFFKGLLDPAKYASGRTGGDILAMVVTEFYGLKKIDAKGAWYVVGSDVLGPMGHELVPLATLADAEEFRKDHKGTRIVRFDQVNRELLKSLDR